jgi:CRISPR-associated protein Cas6
MADASFSAAPRVDLYFPLKSTRIPTDHSYLLYAALCQALPDLHQDRQTGIFAIQGTFCPPRQLELTPHSHLKLRVPQAAVGHYLSLAGQKLALGPGTLELKGGFLKTLKPAARLYSRLVVIKGFTEPEPFLAAARKQLAALEIAAEPTLIAQPEIAAANQGQAGGSHSPVLRRTLRIRDRQIVGFAVQVNGLSAEESLRLQEQGLGGRRHFGCGLFLPARG